MSCKIIEHFIKSPLQYGDEILGQVENLMPHPKTGVMPELAIIAAARTSFLGYSGDLVRDKTLLGYLYRHQHTSPWEMAEVVLRLTMSDREWMDLLIDQRMRVHVLFPSLRSDLVENANRREGMIKIDANNFVKFLQTNKTPEPQSVLKKALTRIIPVAYPWLAELLEMEPANSVSVDTALVYPDKVFVLNDQCWLQLVEISGTDEQLADTIRYHRPDLKLPQTDTEAVIYEMFRLGDPRPLSMFSMRFLVRAPVVTLWQWTRHRTMNFSLQSGRYTEFDESDFVVPFDWRKQSKSNKQGSSDERLDEEDYRSLLETWGDYRPLRELIDFYEISSPSQMLTAYDGLGHRLYQTLLRQGAAREQARFFLPAWGSLYRALIKTDLMSLLRFLRLRTAPDAQLEIREYAQALTQVWAEHMPITARIAADFNYNGV